MNKANIDKKTLKMLVNNGKTSSQIANILSVSRPTVIKYAKEFGLYVKLMETGTKAHKQHARTARLNFRNQK